MTLNKQADNLTKKRRKAPVKVPSERQRYMAIWKTQVKRQIRKRSGKPAIAQWQFLNWCTPGAPSFSDEIKAAADKGDFDTLRDLCRQQRRDLFHEESVYPWQQKESNHEFCIRDILFICGIPFSYQVPVNIGKSGNRLEDQIDPATGEVTQSEPTNHSIIADFVFPDGRIFEIFGVRFSDYRDRQYQKTIELADDLWYVNLMHVSVESDNTAILGYAIVLDENVCHKQRCNLSLFNFSVEELLTKKVPLLFGKNLDLCKNYLIQLSKMGISKYKYRSTINQQNAKKPSGYGAPSYTPPRPEDVVRNSFGDEVPQIYQINRVSPLAKMKARQQEWAQQPQRAPLKMPMAPARVAQVQDENPMKIQPQDGGHAPTMEEINSAITNQYKSSHLWSDEEKVAVYFKTPKALMQAMQLIQPAEAEPMQMVARNWYERMTLGTRV